MRPPFAAFRAVLCLSTALMMASSWPLWVSTGVFPRIPFVRGLGMIPLGASWVRLGLALAAMGLAASGVRWRGALSVAVGLFVWMVLEDQHRLQPWMFQFVLMGFALATCPEPQAQRLCRVFLIALYFHSGLSKLDAAFVQGLGGTFLKTGVGFLGISPAEWPERLRAAAILGMPTVEILVALGLMFERTRRVSVALAVALHAALILILGPWGLGHSANVLGWNAAIGCEVVLLFGWPGVLFGEAPSREGRHADPFPSAYLPITPEASEISEGFARLVPVARLFMLLAALLPFGERAGIWDTWPSFALYAAHDERVDFVIAADDLAMFPEEVRRHFRGVGGLEVLQINEWSLAERRAPAYPQGRSLIGVAEALAARYRGPRPARVTLRGRADALTGRRANLELFGLEAIRRHGDSYLVNAHPVP